MFSTWLWEHKEGPVVIIAHYQCCGKDTGLRNVAQDKCGPEWRPQRDDPEFVSKPKPCQEHRQNFAKAFVN